MLKSLILACVLLFPFSISNANLIENEVDIYAKEIACLAKAIYHEAKGESTLGMIAVGHVILNRTKSDVYPDTVCKVVYQRGQFDGINHRKVTDRHQESRAKDVAYWVMFGLENDPTKGAMYFHSKHIDAGWKRRPKAIIGNHIFY